MREFLHEVEKSPVPREIELLAERLQDLLDRKSKRGAPEH